MKRGYANLLIGLLLMGCAGPKIVVNGIEVYEKTWNRAISELRPRAAFELGCNADQFVFGLLKRHGRQPTEVTVSGCGRQALYVRPTVQQGAYSAMGSWLLSSVNSTVPTQ